MADVASDDVLGIWGDASVSLEQSRQSSMRENVVEPATAAPTVSLEKLEEQNRILEKSVSCLVKELSVKQDECEVAYALSPKPKKMDHIESTSTDEIKTGNVELSRKLDSIKEMLEKKDQSVLKDINTIRAATDLETTKESEELIDNLKQKLADKDSEMESAMQFMVETIEEKEETIAELRRETARFEQRLESKEDEMNEEIGASDALYDEVRELRKLILNLKKKVENQATEKQELLRERSTRVVEARNLTEKASSLRSRLEEKDLEIKKHEETIEALRAQMIQEEEKHQEAQCISQGKESELRDMIQTFSEKLSVRERCLEKKEEELEELRKTQAELGKNIAQRQADLQMQETHLFCSLSATLHLIFTPQINSES